MGIMERMPCKHESIKKFDHWYKTFVHEVFHVFGIAHTMRRTDRDDYIEVSDRILNNTQFTKDALIPFPGGYKIPYECHSIMHYKPGSDEFKAVDPWTCRFNSKEPTYNDWQALM